jgi:septum formation protein
MALDVFAIKAHSALLEYSIMITGRIILASGSPRRRELLNQLGYQFEVKIPQVEEIRSNDECAQDYVARLSQDKARAAQHLVEQLEGGSQDVVFLGSDTIVVAQQQILEKPVDFADAQRMLLLLSDHCHQVMTAVTVIKNEVVKTVVVVTDVWFKSLSLEEIVQYWNSGEPQDKAGSYAIQGLGGKFVTRIEGSYYAVVGLPLFETEQLLRECL